jgi:alcohol dehydrogenase
MALAATMAGISFNMNANAIVHAASTPVTAKHDVPHGVANAIFMAPGLEFLLPAVPERLGDVGTALGEDVSGLPPEEAGRRGIEAVRSLLRDAGLPQSLREAGVDPADVDVPGLIEDALESRNIATNPRPVTSEDLETIYLVVLE